MSCCLNVSITLFFGSSNSQGSQIANYWALSSTPSVALDHQWTRGETKKVLHAQTLSLWQKEWAASVNGQFTRRFFPDIASAYVLKERPTNNITSQVLTGHCVLNGHQHRFGFISSPLCVCSLAPETIEHFLFECTFHADARVCFKARVQEAGSSWPPPLALIPQSSLVWKAAFKFIKTSNRFKFPLSRSQDVRVDGSQFCTILCPLPNSPIQLPSLNSIDSPHVGLIELSRNTVLPEPSVLPVSPR